MNDPPGLADRRRKWRKRLVREERLELSRIAPLDPKSSAYASFATLARKSHILQGDEFNTALSRRQEEERPPGHCGAAFFRMGQALLRPHPGRSAGFFKAERRAGAEGGRPEARESCRSAAARAFFPPAGSVSCGGIPGLRPAFKRRRALTGGGVSPGAFLCAEATKEAGAAFRAVAGEEKAL